ncbi:MAG: helix-turn-helix domain-containing protein [Ruminococcus sp.]|nr:helix-turn-helix domain-containing protein [Ruminococcus sp.]
MNIEIANRLLQYRKKNNLSQEELAGKIGVSRQAVSKWERAEASPDTDNLILLANLYGVTLDELLQGKSEPEAVKMEEENTQPDNNENKKVENDDSENEENESDYQQNNENTNFHKCDKVSFKNGLHVHTHDGDHVDISFKDGVKVHDKKGTKVNVDFNGIYVEENGEKKVYTDENGHVFYSDEVKEKCKKPKSIWNKFPYPIISVIVFLAWGFSGLCMGFKLSWIVFLTIPIYYTLVDAIIKRKPSHFCYPALVVMVYLFLGLSLELWHPMWVLYLTIPVYYFICDFFKPNTESEDKD